jgi:hypothetical protein
MKSSLRFIAVTLFCTTAFLPLVSAQEPEPAAQQAIPAPDEVIEGTSAPMRSALGYEAIIALPPVEDTETEGSKATIILKDNKIIARIENARPVMFSPRGDILLLADAAPDDDCQYFLMNVAGGEKTPSFSERHRIGGRYANRAKWTKDGKKIFFTTVDIDDAETLASVVEVAEHLGKNPHRQALDAAARLSEVEQKVLLQHYEISLKELTEAEKNAAAATAPEQQAQTRLLLEKCRQWHRELESRLARAGGASTSSQPDGEAGR